MSASDRPKPGFDRTVDNVVNTIGFVWDFFGDPPPEPPKSKPEEERPTDPANPLPENVLDVEGHEVEGHEVE